MPPDFVQHKEPKLLVDDLTPVEWPDDPSLEWCPPGHGDLYTALLTSGMLEALLDGGFRYAFMSNSDNLAAVLEPRVLAWIAREEIPFVMEVTDRTEADRKGGHLARRPDGGYVLRETAQTPEEDLDALQDIGRHRYVNTNNLWVDLRVLERVLRERDGVLGLPLIVNRKTRRPGRQVHAGRLPARDRDGRGGRRVRRRAAAAGAAARASRRSRRPRTCWRCARTPTCCTTTRASSSPPQRDGRPPVVDLDDDHYKRLADFDARFPAGAPSLVECERLAVRGRRARSGATSSCAGR